MKTITVVCNDKEGIHARPAGLLNKAAKAHTCSVTMTKGDKTADIKRIFALMGLGVKCGDTITVTCDGPDEEAAAAELEAILKAM